jgi:hydroxymethyl cephem carbamoyltransferase
MLILGLKPGHDGAIAAIGDRELLYSLESEKDTGLRHAHLSGITFLQMCERLGAVPDVVALGGWWGERGPTGYGGVNELEQHTTNFMGKQVNFFTSSHERSHLLMSVGMAPRDDFTERVVLTWEGTVGSFYVLGERFEVKREIPVLGWPGVRYAMPFAIADPSFADARQWPRHEDSGKLMALASFANPDDADAEITALVDDIMSRPKLPVPKSEYRNSPIYNAGVEAQETKVTAALITKRIFERYAQTAVRDFPAGLPLHISGGCGLNCDWNRMWQDLGHFSSVFVPPCTNDSGSALGTAMDALGVMTGDPYIDWNVYSGREFDRDADPSPSDWQRRPLDLNELAAAVGDGHVVAWVQGRWEIGPRALGNRSLIAEPSRASTKDRLNSIKQREDYRPIAPACRVDDLGEAFDADFEDPYMLFFRMVRRPEKLQAVTHVDGSARCQTVSREDNERFYALLSAVAERSGMGVLCNTSLNFRGFGFINRMSDLARYAKDRDLDGMIVGDEWFERRRGPAAQVQTGREAPAAVPSG